MSDAHLAIVLHAHLPFVHHPEHKTFLEEEWFFEAVTETYVPILLAWNRLSDEGVPFRVTVSLTPTLLEMFVNPLLKQRCRQYLNRRIELAQKEARHKGRSAGERAVALHYLERFRQVRDFLFRKHDGDLVPAFKEIQDAGHLEVLASAATHGFLPLMLTPNAVRAQVEIGVETVTRHLGRRPKGFWLPECAYRPGMDRALAEAGIRYFLVDAHGILNAFPTSPHGVHAPVVCPSGVAAFGRDLEASKQVWSSEEGYPGDGAYREFYRDLGYDASYDYIEPYLHDDGVRRNLGLKYYRVTGRVGLHEKQLYDRAAAVRKAVEHGGHFVFCRQHQLRFLKSKLSVPPIVVAPYDAELFGHWWYEGPEFLEQVFRASQFVRDDYVVSTLSEYLDQHPPEQVSTPSSSSWGDKGYFEVWLNGANDWIYRHLHKAEERMVELAGLAAAKQKPAPGARSRGRSLRTPHSALRTPKSVLSKVEAAALQQAARELLLAQSSDWAFLMTTGGAAPYAEKRTRNHLHRFTRLYEMLRSGNVDKKYVETLTVQNPIFPDLDWRAYL
jgi:1,4-alpha-glucan branching enzyme